MISIFGKLYTLLRRPRNEPEETPEATTESESPATVGAASMSTSQTEQTTECPVTSEQAQTSKVTEAGRTTLQKQDLSINQSGTDVDFVHIESNEIGEAPEPKQVMRNETMDMEAMSKLVDEIQAESEKVAETKPDPATTSIEPTMDTETSTTTTSEPKPSKDQEMTVDHEQAKDAVERLAATDKSTKQEECKDNKAGDAAGAGRKEKSQKQRGKKDGAEKKKNDDNKVYLYEKDFNSYKEFAEAMTEKGTNINPKDLLYKLGYEKLNSETMGTVIIGQYKLATSRNRWQWVSQARYFAELFFPNSWIDDNLTSRDGRKSTRRDKPRQQKTKKYNVNEQYEGRRAMCQDVRLLENPNLPVVSSNFGNKKKAETKTSEETVDQFVTEYTTGIINEAVRKAVEESNVSSENAGTDTDIRGAMREAMDGGLSESMIMEVINDVTNIAASPAASRTPGKRGKVNKPDTRRTPRKRPEELAVGFNYLADELVKHSPKTVDGGIICMETLPPSRERPEQLAFGFNFHADKLVKESPVSEKGDILIPGVVLTPGRKARDQLAMGFNYHSDVIVKESPKSSNSDNKTVNKGKKKRLAMDENVDVDSDHKVDNSGDNSNKVKNSQENKLAIGFSKNADLIAHADKMVMKVLGEKDMNMLNEHAGNLEAEIDEERNNLESDDSFVPTMVPSRLPAGSVW